MRRRLLIPMLFVLTILLSSCMEQGGKEFLPEECQSYNQFMYLVSDDLYQMLIDNGYNIRSSRFANSVAEVRSLKLVSNTEEDLDLNGLQCFPYLNNLELEGKAIKDISPLTNLERIESLIIKDTRIFDLKPLWKMEKLKTLEITGTTTLQSLSGVENFKRLKEVTLSNNGLIEVDQLAELVDLETINLNNNAIQSIEKLGSLPKLTTLNVEDNYIDFDSVDGPIGFSNLQVFKAKSNNICKTDAFLTFQNLTELDLSDNNLGNYKEGTNCDVEEIDFSFLKHTPALEKIYVNNNGIKSLNTILDIELPKLKELDFSNNEIPSIQPLIQNTSLQQGTLTTLKVSNNEITEVINIDQLKGLTDLQLAKNDIGLNGDSIDSVFKLSGLTNLDLSRNYIKTIPSIDANTMPVIETIDLSHNEINEVSYIQDNDSLKTLYLNNNQINTINNSFNNMDLLEKVVFIDVTNTVDEKNQKEERNVISQINNSFSKLPVINFVEEDSEMYEKEENVFSFNFHVNNVEITNSFNDLDQFTKVKLGYFTILNINDHSLKMANVKDVDISGNELTNITFINNLPKLKILYANYNKIAADYSQFTELKSLEELYLMNNQINNVEFVNKIPNIKILDLSMNSIAMVPSNSSVKLLDGFSNLEFLNLSDNNITEINGISNLNNLTYLNISNNFDEAGNEITRINGMVNLPKLTDVNNFIITTNSINYINGFSNIGIGKSDPYSFDLYNLISNNNNNSNILEITPISLKDNNFRYMNLYGKNITDFSFVSNLTYIDSLNLDYTNIVDLTPLSGLNQLTSLYIYKIYNSENKITNVTPLQNLSSLTFLSLDNNNISDVSSLQRLTNLYYLSLNHNNIQTIKSSGNTSVFDQMKSLQNLYLDGNPFTELVGLNNLPLTYLSIPSGVTKYTNTLNGTNNLENINHTSTSTYSISDINVVIDGSFNSTPFTSLSFPANYSNALQNSFKYVKRLNLANTQYTSINFITGFENLEELSLTSNTTISSIDSLTCMNGELPKLNTIYLNDSSITKVTNSFNGCSNLSNIALDNNMTTIQNSFNSPALEYLSIPSNMDVNLNISSSFGNLKTLNVSSTSLNNYSFIGNLTKLESLDASYISMDFKIIENLKNLKFLYLYGPRGTFSSLPVNVQNLPALEHFYLSDIAIDTLSSQFTNHGKISYVNFSNVTINNLQNSFTGNGNLSSIYFYNSSINDISGSFNSNSLLSDINLNNNNVYTNISRIYNSFGNNPVLSSVSLPSVTAIENSFDNNQLYSINLNNTQSIINSFDNNKNLNNVYINNNANLTIDNSFNDTNISSISMFSSPDKVTKLSGFNNTPMTQLNTGQFYNLTAINGFANVKLTNIDIYNSLNLTDISFMNNIDKASVQSIYINRANVASSTLKSYINLIASDTNSSLSTLQLWNVLTDLDGVNLKINNFYTLTISHSNDSVNYAKINTLLAKKTSGNTLYITQEMYNNLRTYFYNNMPDSTVEAAIKQDIRNSINTYNLTEAEIQAEVDRQYSEITIEQFNEKKEVLVDIKMSNYYYY